MHEGSTMNGAAMTLATHLRDVHGIEPTSVTQMSVHHDRVLRVDRADGAQLDRSDPLARTAGLQ